MTEKVKTQAANPRRLVNFSFSKVVHQKPVEFEGSEAWEYQNGVQLDVPNSLVYSKVEKVIKTYV